MMKQLEVLGLEKSRTGEIAAAFREMIRGGQILRQPSYLRLVDALDSGGARCLTEVYEQGARDFVERLAGEPMAEAVGKIAARLPLYPYASGVSRRSFRSSSLQANMRPFVRLLGCVFMPKLEASGLPVILRRISRYKNKRGGEAHLPADLNVMADFVWEHFIALALDEEGGSVSEEIRVVGENGSVGSVGEAVRAGLSEGKCDRGLRQMLLRAVLKSERRDLFEFVKGYAQTENGLGWDVARAVELLQAGSEGRVEGQLALLAWVAEYDLWRYEAVAGTVKVWMGFGPFRADGGMMEKIVRLALRLAGDPAACRQAVFGSELEGVWAGLWVSTLSDVEEVLPLLKELLRQGDKIQKLAALSFAAELDDKSAQVELVSGLLSDPCTDPDVLCLAMANFDMSYVPTMQTREGWQGVSRSLSALADAGARDRYFTDLSGLLKGMPAAGYRLSAEPFRGALSRECLYANLFLIAAADYDKMKISELIDLMPGCEAETRRRFVDVFISESWVQHERERDFLFQCLHDKSMIVRRTAVEKLAAGGKWDEEGGWAVPLSVGERTAVMKLLAVKTEGMREPCLRILLGQPTETALACAGELCGAKGEEKRLAGLALLEELRVAARITDDTCADVLADAAAVVPLEQRGGEERDFVRSLRHGTGADTLEQVLGIFDPQYKPAVLERFSLKQLPGDECAVAGVSETRIMSLLAAMCAQVEVHKDFVFTRVNYDFSEEETVLGSLAYPVLPNTTARRERKGYTLDDFVLPEVWRAWRTENQVELPEVLVMALAYRRGQASEPELPAWVDDVYGKVLPMAVIRDCAAAFPKREYGSLAMALIEKFIDEFEPADVFQAACGAVFGLIEIAGGAVDSGLEKQGFCLSDITEVDCLLDLMERFAADDEGFMRYAAACVHLGQMSGRPCVRLDVRQIARAAALGLVKDDLLFQFLCREGLGEAFALWEQQRQGCLVMEASAAALLVNALKKLSRRVIEIVLREPTCGRLPVSPLAADIVYHEGVWAFVGIVTALLRQAQRPRCGQEQGKKGHERKTAEKRDVLQSLLGASVPAEGDTAQGLGRMLQEAKPAWGEEGGEEGGVSERFLAEAALLAPAWTRLVAEFLGWPGLLSAVCFIRVHLGCDMPEETDGDKNFPVERLTPLKVKEIGEGAFDVGWLRSICQDLGEERFLRLLDAAAGLTGVGQYERMRLFVNAALDKIPLEKLYHEAAEQRRTDNILCLSLAPLREDAVSDTSERYLFIREFLEQSQCLAPRRRARERKACAVALRNLAGLAGHS